jgi:hypothetical protein
MDRRANATLVHFARIARVMPVPCFGFTHTHSGCDESVQRYMRSLWVLYASAWLVILEPRWLGLTNRRESCVKAGDEALT